MESESQLDSRESPPKALEAPNTFAVRTVPLPLYENRKQGVLGGTVGRRVAGAKKGSEQGSGESGRRSVVICRPQSARNSGEQNEPLRLEKSSVSGGLELQRAFPGSGESQTGKPCRKRRREGLVWGGNPAPQSVTLFPPNGPSENLEVVPLMQPSVSLTQGLTPRTFAAADAPWRDLPSISKERGSEESSQSGFLGGRGTSSAGFDQSGIGLGRERPVETSWPIKLQFGTGMGYPVLEERSGTGSWANLPRKPGFREYYFLPENGVNAFHGGVRDLKAGFTDPNAGLTDPIAGINAPMCGFDDPSGGSDNLNAGVVAPNPGLSTPNYGVDDLTGGLDELNASITALLTDHMHQLLDAQEAQLGAACSDLCPVELSPGQMANILDRQGQMKAALEYLKTLTSSAQTGVKTTRLSPSTGENCSSGQPSFSGTQSYTAETVCPRRRVPIEREQSGSRDQVNGLKLRFGGTSPSLHVGTERSSRLSIARNGYVGRLQAPSLVRLVGRFPVDTLAEPAKDAWPSKRTVSGQVECPGTGGRSPFDSPLTEYF